VLEGDNATATITQGSYRWSAPELSIGSDVHRTHESDIYAFGCTCVEVRCSIDPTICMHRLDLLGVDERDALPAHQERLSGYASSNDRGQA
jgi:serine/threonine protein kinase